MFSTKGVHNSLKGMRSPTAANQYFGEVFAAYLATAHRESPLALEMGIHPFHSCLPDRINTLDYICELITAEPAVWVSTFAELAAFWRAEVQHDDDAFEWQVRGESARSAASATGAGR
jgi:hypothetical protein